MSVPPIRVSGITGAAPNIAISVATGPVAMFSVDGLQVKGKVLINGERALTARDVGPMAQVDAAALGGAVGGAFVLFVLLMTRVAMTLFKARAMRRWLARQPRPDAGPYRSPMFEGAHRQAPPPPVRA